MRTIAVVTTSRADYGIYRPLWRAITSAPDLHLQIIAAGMHLSPEFGLTVRDIEADGFTVDERVELLLSSDTPEGIAKSVGVGVLGYAQIFARTRPDILVLLGDRFEMHAAAVAALPFTLPIAHLHGGEVTQGAFDDALRHSLTKLSHLHFVSTAAYARRVAQLGEEPWRITVSGALSLDNLTTLDLLNYHELEQRVGMALEPPPLLVTFHPVTLEPGQTEWQIDELLAALETSGYPVVFTMPNADTGGRAIAQKITHFVQTHQAACLVDNLGTRAYFSMMQHAAAMVGNSSSGILEAASFKLPVVNIGTRQQGRIRAANVIDSGYKREEVAVAIQRATSTDFRASLHSLVNPYGDGHAAGRIVQKLQEVDLDTALVVKCFCDTPQQDS